MVSAPEQVHPAGTVPQAAENHGENVVEISAEFAVSVAAEGNVEVVAQPCGEGDVPAAPEVGRVLRFERRVEVLLELITEQQCKADGHIGVAGEVAIQLEGEAEPAEQVLHAGVEHGIVEHAVDEVAADVVGNNDLLDEAGHDEHHTFAHHSAGGGTVGADLRQDVDGAHHRAGQQRREEGEREGVVEQVALRFELAAVDVDDVADGAEGEERNAGGKDDVEGVEVATSDVGGCLKQQVEVLEIQQYTEVYHHIERHDAAPSGVAAQRIKPAAEQVVAQTHTEQNKATFGTGFVVEKQ